ncbi:hypothetical protein AS188_01945 [Kocuria flava]|uniref:Thoeris protein ThsB TIR-like domain-containing protein n=1 Tax=Kocuria flava TaxID=446860 RepID=A0A0U3I5R4_9MICC|nr:TIR domain-containing protein [Kocuria flava]ALU38716.1 hypothetical protein AS188_01945 [Kocuria flava]GEO93684.1 hypothetical protein KFL01_29900 [Kocuria flava]
MEPKTVYLACAAEDELYRGLFTTQWSRAGATARFLGPPEEDAPDEDWQREVRGRVRESDGVIALIGGYTETSDEALWPIRCAVAEKKPLLGLWMETQHRVKPTVMGSARCKGWTWENIGEFLEAI